MSARKNRSPAQTWKVIEDGATSDTEMDRILALSDSALDADLAAAGFDVPALDANSDAFIAELQRGRALHGEAADRLRRARALIASRPARREKLDRATLEARITTARNDPRFSAPAAILFRNRETKEATDEELTHLLDTLEALAEIVEK